MSLNVQQEIMHTIRLYYEQPCPSYMQTISKTHDNLYEYRPVMRYSEQEGSKLTAKNGSTTHPRSQVNEQQNLDIDLMHSMLLIVISSSCRVILQHKSINLSSIQPMSQSSTTKQCHRSSSSTSQ